MVKNFYIFRHGQSSYNLDDRIQGHTNNSVLTNKGIDQAYHAGEILSNKNIELIVSSPLRRARQTSMILSKILKTHVHFDDKLAESNLGIIEGMKHSKAKQEFAEDYAKWQNPKHIDVSFKDGESKKQVLDRVFSSLNKYADSPYQNIALSGHKDALSQILMAINKNTAPEIPNGSVIHLQYDNGEWKYVGLLQ
jgi:probable phosphoglycerate mutase